MAPPPVPLADVLLALSRLADLGFALPAGSGARSAVLASRLARSLRLPDGEVRTAYFTALLHHVGCVGYATETARLFGDELAVNQAVGRTDLGSARDVLVTFLPALAAGQPPRRQATLALALLARGGRWGDGFTIAACEVGQHAARRLGLGDDVAHALGHVFDLWRDAGGSLPLPARIARTTGVAVLLESLGGVDTALDGVRRRSGGMLDPDVCAAFVPAAPGWFSELARTELTSAALGAEPEPRLTTTDLPAVATVLADLADLQSPFLAGHSRTVSALAAEAAGRLGLPAAVRSDVALAGLVHDVGRVAVSAGIWARGDRLDTDAWEQVRVHPYHTERILAASRTLARLAPLAGRHHERLDGSGYHRGCRAGDLTPEARVLATADAYCGATQPRPHRPALAPAVVAALLRADARAGRLDAGAVEAVLAAAEGRPPGPSPPARVSGLSAREVQVLRLVARGRSNAGIAADLVISRRTAEHHVQHVYQKIGVRSRAAATLFAVEHGLLDG